MFNITYYAFLNWIELIADGAVVLAAFVALLEYIRWRKNLIYKEKFEVARSTLRCLYIIHDNINRIRRSGLVYHLAKAKAKVRQLALNIVDIDFFKVELDKIDNYKSQLVALELDVEVLINKSHVTNRLRDFVKLVSTFEGKCLIYFSDRYNKNNAEGKDFEEETEKIIFTSKNDDFGNEFNSLYDELRNDLMAVVSPKGILLRIAAEIKRKRRFKKS